MSARWSLARAWADRSGVAATEFALLLPVMLALLLGTIEIGNVLLVDRKVTAATQSIGDLAAQEKTLSARQIDDIFTAMGLILEPFPDTRAAATLYSVVMDDDGNVRVDWSETRGSFAPNPVADVPDGLLVPGDSVVVAEMIYRYQPVFGDLVLGTVNIEDRAYLRPRRTRQIARQ